jgi:hypothetical protein
MNSNNIISFKRETEEAPDVKFFFHNGIELTEIKPKGDEMNPREAMQSAFEESRFYMCGESQADRIANWDVWKDAWQTLLAAQIQQTNNLLIGEMKDNGVNWHDKNPHAFPVGTKFFALPPAPMNEVNKPKGDNK